jgi:hypothetical protein
MVKDTLIDLEINPDFSGKVNLNLLHHLCVFR